MDWILIILISNYLHESKKQSNVLFSPSVYLEVKTFLIKHKIAQQKYLTRNLFLKFLLLSTHDTGGIKDLEESQGAVQKLKLSNTITVPNLFS